MEAVGNTSLGGSVSSVDAVQLWTRALASLVYCPKSGSPDFHACDSISLCSLSSAQEEEESSPQPKDIYPYSDGECTPQAR